MAARTYPENNPGMASDSDSSYTYSGSNTEEKTDSDFDPTAAALAEYHSNTSSIDDSDDVVDSADPGRATKIYAQSSTVECRGAALHVCRYCLDKLKMHTPQNPVDLNARAGASRGGDGEHQEEESAVCILVQVPPTTLENNRRHATARRRRNALPK